MCRNKNLLTVGTGVPDCPNRTAAGASPRPTVRSHLFSPNEIILFKIHHLLLPKNTLGQPRTSVPKFIMREGGEPFTYKLTNVPCPRTNKPHLKAPLSKGSWRRQASEGLFMVPSFFKRRKILQLLDVSATSSGAIIVYLARWRYMGAPGLFFRTYFLLCDFIKTSLP